MINGPDIYKRDLLSDIMRFFDPVRSLLFQDRVDFYYKKVFDII